MKENDFLIPWNRNDLDIYHTEILVLGSGIAGLFAAINLCNKYEVTVLTKKSVMEGNTGHAQGGIAVALNQDDSPEFHYQDTIQAGAGLCNLEAVKVLAEKGPDCVGKLIGLGTQFDRHGNKLDFTREAAHSKRRVLHANGDATGEEIARTLVEEIYMRPINIRENNFVIDFLKNKANEVIGILIFNENTKNLEAWLARAVVLATGGIGQLYKYTTNPGVSTGDGIAAAYRAGAELMDMEFVQFHPTALLLPNVPNFLISEAARGEGARLFNDKGERFMESIPGQELASRDIVARAIWEQMRDGKVFLDFSFLGSNVARERFPNIYKTCMQYGVDITKTPVPVGPAAHYLMGGVRADIFGQTSLPNLFACGECACNGVHGANRLASNSLLDGLVFAEVVSEIIEQKIRTEPKWEDVDKRVNRANSKQGSFEQGYLNSSELKTQLQEIMWDKVGIIRDKKSLLEAQDILLKLAETFKPVTGVSDLEVANMLILGLVIVQAALAREESRGGHFRSDFPLEDERKQKHSVSKKGEEVRYVSL